MPLKVSFVMDDISEIVKKLHFEEWIHPVSLVHLPFSSGWPAT